MPFVAVEFLFRIQLQLQGSVELLDGLRGLSGEILAREHQLIDDHFPVVRVFTLLLQFIEARQAEVGLFRIHGFENALADIRIHQLFDTRFLIAEFIPPGAVVETVQYGDAGSYQAEYAQIE